MAYKEISGNIFNSSAMAIVNTVNCVGAMGKGVALDFKLRYPEMFAEYKKICEQGLLHPGNILPYRKSKPIILNFAIKDDWKQPSKIEWIEETLLKFTENYKRLKITSIAFPWMGAMNGGIPINVIKQIMRKYLSKLDDIDIEVYDFDPSEPCILFNELQKIITSRKYTYHDLFLASDIHERYWEKICYVIIEEKVCSMNTLCSYKINNESIIGKTNIERLYHFLTKNINGIGNLPLTFF